MKRTLLFFVLCSSSVLNSIAQITKANPQNEAPGFSFYLPRAKLEFEFTVTENRFTPGELSSFASQYFQTGAEQNKKSSSFTLENISVSQTGVIDPSQHYIISPKIVEKLSIQTVNGGIIKSINGSTDYQIGNHKTGIVSTFSRPDEGYDNKIPFFSLGTRNDTIINREITPDSTIIERRIINRRTVSNTPEEMARESVKKLDEIRKTRYMLISGPEDIVMDGKSLEISLAELEKTEQELLALFFGKTRKLKQTYRIGHIPGESTDTLFYLSAENGVSMSELPGYMPVKISYKTTGYQTTTFIPSEKAKNNPIPYRIPPKVIVSIVWNNSKYFETELIIPQFGEVIEVPVNNLTNLKVIYDENTGIIESIGPGGAK
jgi:hypothetical protein